MKRALVNIRAEPHYRRHAFVTGLQRHGWKIVDRLDKPEAGDLFVSWNQHGDREQTANKFREAGGRVLVCENGVIGTDEHGIQLYAIARDAHHAGTWFVGDYSRWEKLGIPVMPWTMRGGYVLVCGQRGIGSRMMASPPNWHVQVARQIELAKHHPWVRPHPGWASGQKLAPLERDLHGASVCAVWSSMAGVKALTMGVPVAYWAPYWVASAGAGFQIEGIQNPVRDDKARKEALTRVAWYQWRVAEIEAGLPFEVLL